jgi:outer membrane biosynthesis protein TonB
LLEQTVRLPVLLEKEEELSAKSCEQANHPSKQKDGLRERKEKSVERKEKTREQPKKEEEQPSRALEPSEKTSKQKEKSPRRKETSLWSMNRFSAPSNANSKLDALLRVHLGTGVDGAARDLRSATGSIRFEPSWRGSSCDVT